MQIVIQVVDLVQMQVKQIVLLVCYQIFWQIINVFNAELIVPSVQQPFQLLVINVKAGFT